MTVLLRVGVRVRALVGDGFVTAGQTGTVSSVVHPGFAGNHTGWNLVAVSWDDDTRSRVPAADVEVIQAATLTVGGAA